MTKQERDAWAAAYRIYDEYAPGLRQAAALDDENEMACRLFGAALEKINPLYNESDAGGRLILLSVYDILDNVFKEARDRAQNGAESPQEAAQSIGQGNTPPRENDRQIA
jgi:hypothetical protein